MTMENEMGFGFGGYGFLIVLILFIYMIFGGGFGGFGGCGGFGRGGYGYGGCTTNCEVERREIINSARTQYLVEQTAHATQAEVATVGNALGNKIDFYEYQNLRDQLAQERTKNVALETRIYSDAKFGALEAQMESIKCGMLKQPPLYGVSAVCPTTAVINGLGFNGFGGGCGGFANAGVVG